jgi:glycosyltransferase involved in cell wall biosynthesis
VTVVAPHPNYPFGRFYPGTKYWTISRSVENGVTVWRVPHFAEHSLSSVRRALSYLSFMLAATFISPIVGGRPKVVWVYHGPFMTAVAGLWFKALYGSRLVYTCADLWPESFVASGLGTSKLVLRLLYAYRRFINRRADTLVCSTHGTMKSYSADGIQDKQLEYIPVWVDGIPENLELPAALPVSEEIVYAGNLGPGQPLDVVVKAAAILQREGRKVHFSFYGTGATEKDLKALAESEGASNVTFHGRVAPEKAFEASSRSMAQIVALKPSPFFRMSVPSKLFFSFAAGAPLLYALEGEAGEMAAESGGAIEFDARDPESFAASVRKLLDMSQQERDAMRASLRSHYTRNFSRDVLLQKYLHILAPDAAREEAA